MSDEEKLKQLQDINIADYRKEAEQMGYEDIPFLEDRELLSMVPLQEEDLDFIFEKEDNLERYYELRDELSQARREMRQLEQSIAEDNKTLEDPTAKWMQEEKTEWYHDLSSQRLQKEELRQRINAIRREINALTKEKTNERGSR